MNSWTEVNRETRVAPDGRLETTVIYRTPSGGLFFVTEPGWYQRRNTIDPSVFQEEMKAILENEQVALKEQANEQPR